MDFHVLLSYILLGVNLTNGRCFASRAAFFVQPVPLSFYWNSKALSSTSPASYSSLSLPQIVDVAISLAKVADIDRTLGDEDAAVEGFQEGIKLLQSLNLKPEEASLEQRVILIYPRNLSYTSLVYFFNPSDLIWSCVLLQRLSVLEFLNSQVEKKETWFSCPSEVFSRTE